MSIRFLCNVVKNDDRLRSCHENINHYKRFITEKRRLAERSIQAIKLGIQHDVTIQEDYNTLKTLSAFLTEEQRDFLKMLSVEHVPVDERAPEISHLAQQSLGAEHVISIAKYPVSLMITGFFFLMLIFEKLFSLSDVVFLQTFMALLTIVDGTALFLCFTLYKFDLRALTSIQLRGVEKESKIMDTFMRKHGYYSHCSPEAGHIETETPYIRPDIGLFSHHYI